MADTRLPAVDHETRAKYTESPNPTFRYGQKVDATEDGKKWVEGEKAGWTVVDPSKEEPQSVHMSLLCYAVRYACAMLSVPRFRPNRRIESRSRGFRRAYTHPRD